MSSEQWVLNIPLFCLLRIAAWTVGRLDEETACSWFTFFSRTDSQRLITTSVLVPICLPTVCRVHYLHDVDVVVNNT